MKRTILSFIIAILAVFAMNAYAKPIDPKCKPGESADAFICPPETLKAAPTTTSTDTAKVKKEQKVKVAPALTKPSKPRCPKDEYSDEFICPPEDAAKKPAPIMMKPIDPKCKPGATEDAFICPPEEFKAPTTKATK